MTYCVPCSSYIYFVVVVFFIRWIGEDIGGSIECYDPMKNSWRMVGDLPEPRFSMGVVSFEGKRVALKLSCANKYKSNVIFYFLGLIYIVGGCTTSSRHLPDLIR